MEGWIDLETFVYSNFKNSTSMNSKLRKALLAVGILACASMAWATDYRGRVFDRHSKQPLANVIIVDVSGRILATTDAQGVFVLRNLPDETGERLKVVLQGYSPIYIETAKLKASTEISLQLSESPKELHEVVVSADRQERPLKSVPVITRVFSARQIERMGASDLRDVLTLALPGIEFSRHNTSELVSMQGFGAKYLLFLLDGEPISAQNASNIDFSRIDVNSIDRIEYVPGSGSALYGSSAIGGVINIITKRATEPWQAQVGSHIVGKYQQRYEARAGLAGERHNVLGHISYNKFDPYQAPEDVGIVRGSDALNGSIQASYSPISALRLKGSVGLTRSSYHQLPNQLDLISSIANAKLGAQYRISPRQSIDLGLSLDKSTRDRDVLVDLEQGGRIIEPKGRSQENRNLVWNARLQYNLQLGETHQVNLGIEHYREFFRYRLLLDPKGHQMHNTVLYGQHESELIGGLRMSYGLRLDKHSMFGEHITHKATLLRRFGGFDLRLSYAQGFRAPSLTEMYFYFLHPARGGGQAFYIYGNDNLDPETSQRITLQAGYSDHRLTLSGSFFHSFIDNLITTAPHRDDKGALYYRYENVQGKSIIKGIEALARLHLPCGLYLQSSYSYTIDRQMIEDGGIRYNNSRTRPHALSAVLGYTFGGRNYTADLNLSGRYMSSVVYPIRKTAAEIEAEKNAGTFRTQYNSFEDEGYHNVRFTSTLTLFKAYKLQLGIDNILDYQPTRQTLNSTLSPGRRYFVSLYIDLHRIFTK